MTQRKRRLIDAVLKNAAALLGTEYSQLERNKIYAGGSMDCSSYVAAIWSAAGYPLMNAAEDELRTSYREADAAGFDLVYPKSRSLIGKNLPSAKGLLQGYGAEAGDIVFWSFGSTARANKITHVGSIDTEGKNIIHTANNREKCCRVPLTYGDGKICAIIRLKENFVYPELPAIGPPEEESGRSEEWQVRMLQTALNLRRGAKLTVDGSYGSRTEKEVTALNGTIGVAGGLCTKKTWQALDFVNNDDTAAEPESAVHGAKFARVASLATAYGGRGTTYEQVATVSLNTPLLALPELGGWREAALETDGGLRVAYLPAQAIKDI